MLSASRLPHFRHRSDLRGWLREVPGACPQEVRRREARLLGQPEVCGIQVVLSCSLTTGQIVVSDSDVTHYADLINELTQIDENFL